MLSRITARLTYANITATVALFLALGGSAYAGLKLTGNDIRNESLTGLDIRNGTVTGKDVRDLTRSDFRGKRILSQAGGRQIVERDFAVGNDGVGLGSVVCPGDSVATGGGFNNANSGGTVRTSIPAGKSAWVAQVLGATPGSEFGVFVVCAS